MISDAQAFPGGSFDVWLRKSGRRVPPPDSEITFARPPETPTSPDGFGSPEQHTRPIEADVA
jgi:hypothetical protein